VKKGGVLFPVLAALALLGACSPPAADSPDVSKKLQNQQGIKYLEGAGVDQDEKLALQWFKKSAAKLDYTVRRKDSGRSIGLDHGIPYELLMARNPGLDMERLRPGHKLVIPGHPGAQFNLATLYEEGRGAGAKDIDKAVEWYRVSAEAGFTRAEFMMGWLYREGNGVPKDPEQAVEWYLRAANKGLEEALYNLGTLHAVGDGPVKRDVIAAWKWFTLAKRRHGEKAQGELKSSANQEIRDKKMNQATWREAARLVLQRAGADTNGDELALKTRLEKINSGVNDTRVEYLRLRTEALVKQNVRDDPSFADLPKLGLSMTAGDKTEAERQADLFEFKKDPWKNP